ncbi:MAG: ABC transporter permease [Oscillospiraceae bacterium]|nr:ABC transporter permease [Oscillospiraceae bacterium]
MKKLKKTQILRISFAVLCVILVIFLQVLSTILSGLLYHQQAAQRWQGDSELKFSQISVFLRQEADFDTNQITSLHEQINTQLTSASLEISSDDTRLWYDCYSTQGGQMEITGTRKKSAQAFATVVGGDFFIMHTPRIADGSYFQESDLMQDRVVIDTRLAWQLFGSSEVAGMEIRIQNRACLIAGVIEPETDYATETVYGDTGRIYFSYTLYQELQGDSSSTHIDCYEAVLPNPVRNFAKNLISDAIDSGAAQATEQDGQKITKNILDNTVRYTLSGRWEQLRHIRELVTAETVTYPYWENAARIICFDTAMLLFLSILFSVYPVIYLIWLCWKFYRFADRTIWQKRMAYRNRYRPQIPKEQNSEKSSQSE